MLCWIKTGKHEILRGRDDDIYSSVQFVMHVYVTSFFNILEKAVYNVETFFKLNLISAVRNLV